MTKTLFRPNRMASGYVGSLLIILAVLVFSSCKKDGGGSGNSYPRTVDITYKITCTTGNVTVINDASYNNETGGITNLTNVTLPFSQTVRKSVTLGEVIRIAAFHNNSGSATPAFALKLEILVNGSVEKTETFSDPGRLNIAMAYGFQ
ncbi:hypothetical protein [Terrimonas ferruginea]|uniref:hypothetical protein n=1 Tax=Terrimonas ferruginea TaxID=249 RepID=UPI00040AEC3C|nr:hypothetical protein [Terrimonas ferruginea]